MFIYVDAGDDPETPYELLYGRAGYCQALQLVERMCRTTPTSPSAAANTTSGTTSASASSSVQTSPPLLGARGRVVATLCSVCDDIVSAGVAFSARHGLRAPLMWRWHDSMYLGAAHGCAGLS